MDPDSLASTPAETLAHWQDKCARLAFENHRLSVSRMAWVDRATQFQHERDQEREHVRLLKKTVAELQEAVFAASVGERIGPQ